MLMGVSVTLIKGLVALVPAGALLAGSIIMFSKAKTDASLLQVLGAAGLVLVVLTHVFEALELFPWMRWGDKHSIGHYLDLGSAVVALTLFPLGYLLHVLTKPRV
jgi:succinate dehydrogenase/fumarate reductase cytochrome b subunit